MASSNSPCLKCGREDGYHEGNCPNNKDTSLQDFVGRVMEFSFDVTNAGEDRKRASQEEWLEAFTTWLERKYDA